MVNGATVNGKSWNKIEDLENKDSDTAIRYSKGDVNSALGSMFNDDFEKKKTEVKRDKSYPPHPYARIGDYMNSNGGVEALFDREKDVNKYWNKCALIQIALDKGKYDQLENIVAGGAKDSKTIEIRNEEFPHFTILAYLGYCKSLRAVNEHEMPSLEKEIEDVRRLAYDFAMAATRGPKISDPLIEDVFYNAIDHISTMFAERFTEDTMQGQAEERTSFLKAMINPRMQKYIQQMFGQYISGDRNLAGFRDRLDVTKRLFGLLDRMQNDYRNLRKSAESMTDAYLNGSGEDITK